MLHDTLVFKKTNTNNRKKQIKLNCESFNKYSVIQICYTHVLLTLEHKLHNQTLGIDLSHLQNGLIKHELCPFKVQILFVKLNRTRDIINILIINILARQPPTSKVLSYLHRYETKQFIP